MTAAARWFSRCADPTAAGAIDARTETLRQSRRDPIRDRIPYLCALAAGNRVLDVGCVEHTTGFADKPRWLHAHLARAAVRCVGVDILPAQVTQLRARGFHVVCRNIVREGPLEERFDVIVCGEVLEHVDDAGPFIGSLARMLAPRGTVVMTLPNPYYVNTVLRNLRRGDWSLGNVDHVAWFDPPEVCELAERAGLRLSAFRGVAAREARTSFGKLMLRLAPWLVKAGLRPELFCPTILYELR